MSKNPDIATPCSELKGFECPHCKQRDCGAKDSRPSPIGFRRRRFCRSCRHVFTTYEVLATAEMRFMRDRNYSVHVVDEEGQGKLRAQKLLESIDKLPPGALANALAHIVKRIAQNGGTK